MKCPRCSSDTKVTDTRFAHNDTAKRRLRTCKSGECGHSFRTIEYEQEKDIDHELVSAGVCLACGGKTALAKVSLLDDRISVQRQYRCIKCEQDTFTVEKPGEGKQDSIDLHSPLVERRDGTRIPFDRAKLAESFAPLRGKLLDEDGFGGLLAHVESKANPGDVIRTSDIRRHALEFLRRESEMAYLKCVIDWGMADTPDELMSRLGDRDE